jgi:formimidoylglutamate deiminase
MVSDRPTALWAAQAWLTKSDGKQGWCEDVLLTIDANGHWGAVEPNIPRAAALSVHAQCVDVALLPGLVNAHSHAFQRAFAGQAEHRHAGADDFWSWRDRMYRVALSISPEQLKVIAQQLYIELLRGGYTQVCEFHYLHHAPDGAGYAEPYTMAAMLVQAASEVGIGLTLLPTVYERAGMQAPALRRDQRRFAADAEWALGAVREFKASSSNPLLNVGVAIHSIRAVSSASISVVAQKMQGPIHIHVAEQVAEVDECLAATGERPVQWLAGEVALDRRWHLVHATHVTHDEIDTVAASGASLVMCPTTEANLGDGLTDIPHWLAAGVPMSIGSDSHVCRDGFEELRVLEIGQRLALRQRNVCADLNMSTASTAERLFSRVVSAGASACGHTAWGLQRGARADALVLDVSAPSLLGVTPAHWLDARTFSSPASSFERVMVAGRWVLQSGRAPFIAQAAAQFSETVRAVFDSAASP